MPREEIITLFFLMTRFMPFYTTVDESISLAYLENSFHKYYFRIHVSSRWAFMLLLHALFTNPLTRLLEQRSAIDITQNCNRGPICHMQPPPHTDPILAQALFQLCRFCTSYHYQSHFFSHGLKIIGLFQSQSIHLLTSVPSSATILWRSDTWSHHTNEK
jgi:hypothetical protein